MGFLNFNRKKESSGIFIPTAAGYKELTDPPPNYSINEMTRHLGYHTDQVHTYHAVNKEHTGIQSAIVEIFTANIIFILVDKNVTGLNQKTVNDYLSNFSVASEFDSIQTQSILKSAIANKSLDIRFLSEKLELEDPQSDGIHYVKILGLYLYFIDGKLVDFQSADGLNEWAKKLKELNRSFVKSYELAAQRHWKNDISKIINEINLQANAWAGTPDGVDNVYLPLHESEYGTVNFAMLLACHYQKALTLQEFKLINHGRYHRVAPNTFICGKFVYVFDPDGNLQNSSLLEDFEI